MAASRRAQNNGPYAGARAGPPVFTATPRGASSRVRPMDANAARIAELEAQLAAMRGANNPFQETTACAKTTSPPGVFTQMESHDDDPGFIVDNDGSKSLGGDNETPINAPINGDEDIVLAVAETPSEPDDDNTGTHPDGNHCAAEDMAYFYYFKTQLADDATYLMHGRRNQFIFDYGRDLINKVFVQRVHLQRPDKKLEAKEKSHFMKEIRVKALMEWIDTHFIGDSAGLLTRFESMMIRKYVSLELRTSDTANITTLVDRSLTKIVERGTEASFASSATRDNLDDAVMWYMIQDPKEIRG
eukprot:g18649.t1